METTSNPIRLLHLSDLHFFKTDDPVTRLHALVEDLKDKVDGFGYEYLDYLVISGDITNYAQPEEFEQAYLFLTGLFDQFKLPFKRCVIVPGNHDLSWETPAYEWRQRRKVNVQALQPGSYLEQGDGYLVRNDSSYHARFDHFCKFYHNLFQQPYPSKSELQGETFLFPDTKLQFLAFNSAAEIDEFHQTRSSVNLSAVADCLLKAKAQLQQAKEKNELADQDQVLRIAVWHHPVTGNEKIVNDAFLEQLRKADVKLCLHGHVHEDCAELVGYLHPTRKLHIAGAGSFGAGAKERPPSMPRLYNVLEIWRDHSKIRVNTRCLKKDGGAWEGWAVWQGADKDSKRSFYEIELR